MQKRLFSLLLVFAAVASLIAGCVSNPATNGGPRILRVDESDLGYPAFYTVSTRGRGYLLTSLMFDTLVWKDADGIVPLLATAWRSSDDHLTFEFDLVENAKFTDGQPLTARDVKFSFDYVKAHPHPWVALNMVKSVEVVDEHKVRITLTDIYAPFITEVAGNVPILPEHIWKNVTAPGEFNTAEAVIGSGPFTLEQYDVTAGSYTFVANPDYFLGEPQVDRLIFAPVDDAAAALQNGDIDVAQRVKWSVFQDIKTAGKFGTMEGPGFWVYRLYFNFNQPALQNIALRQAMYYAINREELVQKATGGAGVVGNPGHIHPDSEWFTDDVKQYAYDLEQAKSMLDQAGIKDKNGDGIREYQGKALKFELLAASDRSKEAELVQGYLAALGVAVTPKLVEAKAFESMINEGSFALALNGHGSFGGDPVLLARFVSDSSSLGATPGSTTQGGGKWGNAQFDRLFASQLRELDQTKRYATVAEMQQLIADELPTLTLYYTLNTFAYDPSKLNGWFYTKDGVARAVPTLQNKLVYIKGTWGK